MIVIGMRVATWCPRWAGVHCVTWCSGTGLKDRSGWGGVLWAIHPPPSLSFTILAVDLPNVTRDKLFL